MDGVNGIMGATVYKDGKVVAQNVDLSIRPGSAGFRISYTDGDGKRRTLICNQVSGSREGFGVKLNMSVWDATYKTMWSVVGKISNKRYKLTADSEFPRAHKVLAEGSLDM